MIYFIAPAIGQAAEIPSGAQLAPIQQLVRGNGAEVESLDPHKASGVPEANIIHDLFEGLVNFGIQGEIVPGMASGWRTADQKTWIFSLRPEAKWSTGEPVTAQDFVYSWRRLANPETASPYSSYLRYMQLQNSKAILAGQQPVETLGVQALNPQTLQLTLSQPLPYLVKMLAHASLKPVHRATIEQHGDHWTQPKHQVGNGAYKMQEWVVNERITLIRNEHYWDNGKTAINQVQFLPISGEQEISRYRSGTLDMIYDNVPSATFQQLKQEYAGELHKIPAVATYYYTLNTQKPPFDNSKVRQAVALVLDKITLVEKVKGQWDIPAASFTPPAIEGFSLKLPEEASWPRDRRIQTAQTLLQEAGYNKENPLKFSLLYNPLDLHKQLATAASQFWKQALGAEVTLESREWKSYLENLQGGDFQMARTAWAADYNEASAFLNTLLLGSSNNYSGYRSPQFSEWMQKSVTASDEAQRQFCYQQAEAQLATDMPIVPVFHPVDACLIKPYVKGYSLQNPMKVIYTKNLYITQH